MNRNIIIALLLSGLSLSVILLIIWEFHAAAGIRRSTAPSSADVSGLVSASPSLPARTPIDMPEPTPSPSNNPEPAPSPVVPPPLVPDLTKDEITFLHPGAVNNKEDLDFVKARIANGEQPWTGLFSRMSALAVAGINETAPLDENGQKEDGRKAYANALAWYYSGDEKYARNAIGILNVWGRTFDGYSSKIGQNQLQGGWIGALLGPAAEIMRGYDGWKTVDRKALQSMFKKAFYPVLNKMSTWNGNVDLTQIDAMMSIAVFCEDTAEFNLGIQRLQSRIPDYFYLVSDGVRSDASRWYNPQKWVDGLMQETCRDNGHHAQYAMASALHAAEVAWNQGVDVYGPYTERFTTAMELLAGQLPSGDMQGVNNVKTVTRSLFDAWEIGYNHYHNRLGIDLPNTEKLILTRVRASGQSDWNIFYESLTHCMN